MPSETLKIPPYSDRKPFSIFKSKKPSTWPLVLQTIYVSHLNDVSPQNHAEMPTQKSSQQLETICDLQKKTFVQQRMTIPIKEYSNKFLKQPLPSKSNLRYFCRQNMTPPPKIFCHPPEESDVSRCDKSSLNRSCLRRSHPSQLTPFAYPHPPKKQSKCVIQRVNKENTSHSILVANAYRASTVKTSPVTVQDNTLLSENLCAKTPNSYDKRYMEIDVSPFDLQSTERKPEKAQELDTKARYNRRTESEYVGNNKSQTGVPLQRLAQHLTKKFSFGQRSPIDGLMRLSASRALQLFSHVFRKDGSSETVNIKRDVILKGKPNLISSRKVILEEKSFNKGQRSLARESIPFCRPRKRIMTQIGCEQGFQLGGWDTEG